jgi:hypothetical protein
MTTVGYGDHVPVTTIGRLIGAAVMVVGVAVIGAVAAIVALAMALHVALQEEQAFEAEAATLEQRVEVRLARIEALLDGVDANLKAWSPTSVNDPSEIPGKLRSAESPPHRDRPPRRRLPSTHP